MTFSADQIRALKRDVRPQHVRNREVNGRMLSYIEGWHAIAEANRIFGFGCWDRETMESRCVLAREVRGSFLTVYVVRVRITVRVEGSSVIREGYGTGEGRGSSPGESHEFAIKSAETDATKRALATFGKPFGAALYLNAKRSEEKSAAVNDEPRVPSASTEFGAHPQAPMARPAPSPRGLVASSPQALAEHGQALALSSRGAARKPDSMPPPKVAGPQSPDPVRAPESGPDNPVTAPSERHPPYPAPEQVRRDTSVLALGESPRRRNKEHLKFVASQACLVCGRTPGDAHHLRFAQPRAMGRKVSDEFTVPLCRIHHRELHHTGNEIAWWKKAKIEPLEFALRLWKESRSRVEHGRLSDAAREKPHDIADGPETAERTSVPSETSATP